MILPGIQELKAVEQSLRKNNELLALITAQMVELTRTIADLSKQLKESHDALAVKSNSPINYN